MLCGMVSGVRRVVVCRVVVRWCGVERGDVNLCYVKECCCVLTLLDELSLLALQCLMSTDATCALWMGSVRV